MYQEKTDLSHLHYSKDEIANEHPSLSLAPTNFRNVGWSLGNDCPLNCTQCYSRCAREKGMNLNVPIVNRIIKQLKILNVDTVNLGGNEPIYTNGLNPKKSLLPYILEELDKNGIKVGITSAGPTINILNQIYPNHLKLINDVDISLDSPFQKEHDDNRGVNGIYNLANNAIQICRDNNIPHSIIMCGMKWNFTEDRINGMIDLCRRTDSNFRVNPLKPIEQKHMSEILPPQQYFEGLRTILDSCTPIDLSDPAWAASAGIKPEQVSGCPCGTNSFRIHSITPSGEIPVSPCVYLHDYKTGNLVTDSIKDILESIPFQIFRRRKAHPETIEGCGDCSYISVCGAGCASRSYLHNFHLSEGKTKSLFQKDPYCPKENLIPVPQTHIIDSDEALVHMGYLCTGIFKVRK